MITRKNIKHIYISVHPPDGQVRVSAPYKTSEKEINDVIRAKSSWIKKQQEKFKDWKEPVQLNYVTGETHYFLGNKYKLNIVYVDKGPSKVDLTDDKFINLYIKKDSTRLYKEKLLKEWYRKELKKRIPVLIKEWEEVMNVEVREFGVKQMKTRWGTCNIAAKRIWINLELAKKSPNCLEYIVVHEMVHLLERKHNSKFKAYMTQFLPGWEDIKKGLNSNY